jgi:hypothetical protein
MIWRQSARMRENAKPPMVVNLLDFPLAKQPDGQPKPVDSLSHTEARDSLVSRLTNRLTDA